MNSGARFRRKVCVGLCLSVLAGAFLARAQPPAPPPEVRLDLFLLIGQSNMAGRGKVEAEDRQPHPRVWMLTATQEWMPAADPLHFDKPRVAGVGPGLMFGRMVAEKFPGTHIGLVPCAVGGTPIEDWARGGRLYADALARARAAQKRGTFRAILWHQGESDCAETNRVAYLPRLERLIADLRADLGAPDLPFIAGQLGDFGEDGKSQARRRFNAMILELPKRVPRTAVVTSEGAKSIGDGTHFDAATAREMGRRYAAAYFERIAKPEK